MPVSEQLFEQFLTASGLRWKRILETTHQTPDYEVELCDRVVFAEVKEVEENDAEGKAIASLREKGTAVLDGSPGARIRSKILKGAKQLRARSGSFTPTMVVLYNNTWIRDHTRDYDLLTAMYGFEAYTIGELPDGTSGAVDHRLGPKSTVNDEHNTSLSAVAVLRGRELGDLRLDVYHNFFARNPIDAARSTMPRISHFHVVVDGRGRPKAWAPSRADDEY